MENMARFTPSHTPSNSMESLRFHKEGYISTCYVFYELFYKRNRKHFPRFSIRYKNIRGSLKEQFVLPISRFSCFYFLNVTYKMNANVYIY